MSAHDGFHVSMLKKYVPHSSHRFEYNDLEIMENMSYMEKSLKILNNK